MKINNDSFEISSSEKIYWRDVRNLRVLQNKLVIVLKNGSEVQVPQMHSSTIDLVFKVYEKYLFDQKKL